MKPSPYKKDVSHLTILDPYRIARLYGMTDHSLFHALKKVLCAGQRGAKDAAQDVQEAIEALERYQAMQAEDLTATHTNARPGTTPSKVRYKFLEEAE